MSISMRDPVVLSFGDALLRQSDVDVLDGPCWMTDSLISFFFEYFDKIYCGKSYGSPRLVFVSAEMAQLFKLCTPSNAGVFAESLQLSSADHVFLPVNDETSREDAGGNHWSLLVYDRSDNSFRHYDSCSGLNHPHAHKMMANLWPSICGGTLTSADPPPQLREVKCGQQQNSFDCGLFVVFNARDVAESAMLKRAPSESDKSNSEQLRKKLKKFIYEVVANEEYDEIF